MKPLLAADTNDVKQDILDNGECIFIPILEVSYNKPEPFTSFQRNPLKKHVVMEHTVPGIHWLVAFSNFIKNGLPP